MPGAGLPEDVKKQQTENIKARRKDINAKKAAAAVAAAKKRFLRAFFQVVGGQEELKGDKDSSNTCGSKQGSKRQEGLSRALRRLDKINKVYSSCQQ